MKPEIYITIFLLILFGLFIEADLQKLKWKIPEETSVGTKVGNINKFVTSSQIASTEYEVSLINDYFDISLSHDMLVKKKIDLDRFCDESNKCCGQMPCVVPVTVYVTPNTGKRTKFTVEVEVEDINDNAPFFRTPTQKVSVVENSYTGATVSIEGGNDYDVSQSNQIQFYKFQEKSNTFQLDSADLNSLAIMVKRPVDYEKRSVYHAELSACDNKTSCTSQNITIQVRDENDNYPHFIQKRFQTIVREDRPVNEVVIRVTAVDRDGEHFNKTQYNFFGKKDQLLIRTFKINRDTGDIVLLQPLSAVASENYRFKVSATDTVSNSDRNRDIADVEIKIQDINDHRPEIVAFDSRLVEQKSDTDFLIRISENQPAQKLMTLRVSDKDLGANKQVQCYLEHVEGVASDAEEALELKPFDAGVYDLNSRRQFDYEREQRLTTRFQCRDGGQPQQSSSVRIQVEVEDENEFSPMFEKTEYSGELRENAVQGTPVLKLVATDKDGGAQIRYSIQDTEARRRFSIDSGTGQLTSGPVPFDRERQATFELFVTATDAPVNSTVKSVRVSVRVAVKDENDNDPRFSDSSLHFTVRENAVVRTILDGRLMANDHDTNPANKRTTFSLRSVYDERGRRCERQLFQVRPGTGQIDQLESLDRETGRNYTLRVVVTDGGRPRRSSEANATVVVLDENDNSPQWIYPRQQQPVRIVDDGSGNGGANTHLNISDSTERGTLIMRLQALDPDEGESGRVSYRLHGAGANLFLLNQSTGELHTARAPLPLGVFSLRLGASDHGPHPRVSEVVIRINVDDTGGPLSGVNLAIVVAMVAVTLLIALFLVVGIVCVRRRPRLGQEYLPASGDMLKTNGQLQQQHHHNQHLQQQFQYNGSNNSRNNSYIFQSRQDEDCMSTTTGMVAAGGGGFAANDTYLYMQPNYCALSASPPPPQPFTVSMADTINLGQSFHQPGSQFLLPTDHGGSTTPGGKTHIQDIGSHEQHQQQQQRIGSNTLRSNHSGGIGQPSIYGESGSGMMMTPGMYGNSGGVPTSLVMPGNGGEYDGESADSGKGASELDLRLQHHFALLGGNAGRQYPTVSSMAAVAPVTTFGYQGGSQHYYTLSPVNSGSIGSGRYQQNQQMSDHSGSRFLTLNSAGCGPCRRNPNSSPLGIGQQHQNNCRCCSMLPEDEAVAMTTFSQQSGDGGEVVNKADGGWHITANKLPSTDILSTDE